MANKIVRLPVNSALKRYFSSGTYDKTVEKALCHLDVLYTYFARYPCLFKNFGSLVDASGSRGVTLDYTASHPEAAIGLTAFFLAVSLSSAIDSYYETKQKEEDEANQYRQTYSIVHERMNKTKKLSMDEFNEKLNKSLQENPDLKKIYKSVSVSEEGHIDFTLEEQVEEPRSLMKRVGAKLATIVDTSWVTLGLCSFVYWILWIGYGVVTGEFSPAGIGNLGMSSFIAPLVAGAMYPLIKISNWWTNHYGQQQEVSKAEKVDVQTNPKLILAAASDLSKLLKRVTYANERARLEAELIKVGIDPVAVKAAARKPVEALASDRKLHKLGKYQWLKTAASFVLVTIGSYIGAQYAAWIVADVLRVAANISLNTAAISLGLGIAFMVGSVVYGAYQAYQKYQEVEKYKNEVAKFETSLDNLKDSLEAIYAEKLQLIATLKESIIKKSLKPSDVSWVKGQAEKFSGSMVVTPDAKVKTPKSWWEQVKDYGVHAYKFLSGATGGIMIGRIATVAGTGILPFACAALSNPYTAAILVFCGVVYGAFRAYQAYQEAKETRAKALFEQREEKIACLKEQSGLAELQISLLKAKEASLVSAYIKANTSDDLSPAYKSAPSRSVTPPASLFAASKRMRSVSDADAPLLDSSLDTSSSWLPTASLVTVTS